MRVSWLLGVALTLGGLPGQAQPIDVEKVKANAAKLASEAMGQHEEATGGAVFKGASGLLVAEGDSWFDYPFYDVLWALKWKHGFQIESVAHHGDTVESMVFDGYQLQALAETLRTLRDTKRPPRAILLSGGGNDIAGPELIALLNHKRSTLPPLSDAAVQGAVELRLREAYLTLAFAVTEVSKRYFGKPIPILTHGYDFPYPDGRGFWTGFWLLPGPWLKPAFDQKGHTDPQLNAAPMKQLIERFDKAIADLSSVPGLAHVRHVKTLGTLKKADWENELHPGRAGFEAIANRFAEVLSTLPMP